MSRKGKCSALLVMALGFSTIAAVGQAAGHSPTNAQASTIQWAECPENFEADAGVECAEVEVPLDYQNPDGEKTSIWVGRMAATGDRKGVVVSHIGADGLNAATDVSWTELADKSDIRAAFDLVSVTHRGASPFATGGCYDNAEESFNDLVGLKEQPTNREERQQFLDTAKRFVKKCQENLPHDHLTASSEVYARDIEEVRKALGEETINLFSSESHSQATQTYTDLFPDNVRAVVVDGVRDGRRVQGNYWTAWQSLDERDGRIKAAEESLKAVLDECQKHAAECELASDADDQPSAHQKVDAVVAAAEKAPIDVKVIVRYVDADGNVVDEEIIEGELGYFEVSMLVHQVAAMPVEEGPAGMDVLNLLWRSTQGDKETVIELPAEDQETQVTDESTSTVTAQDRLSAAEDTPEDNWYPKSSEMTFIVPCNDSKFAGGMDYAAFRASRAKGVFAKAFSWRPMWCAGWHNPMASGSQSFDAETEHPILFVNAEHSTWNNYEYAKEAAARYPNSFFLTDKGWNSGSSYNSSDCVTSAVNDYLLRLELPNSDTCAAEEEIFPTGVAAQGDGATQGNPVGNGLETVARKLQQLVGGANDTN